jgi:hypothetical protein
MLYTSCLIIDQLENQGYNQDENFSMRSQIEKKLPFKIMIIFKYGKNHEKTSSHYIDFDSFKITVI